MAFRNRGNPFFKPLSTERLFTATACIVPKDRRRYLQGHGLMLRKPTTFESSIAVVEPPRAEPHGQQEGRLQAAFQRFSERDSHAGSFAGTPVSFASCAVHDLPAGPQDQWATPRGSNAPTPNRLSDAPADPYAAVEEQASGQFMRYDSVQQAWFQHPAGLNSGGGKLSAYRRCMGDPPNMAPRDYIRPHTSRDQRGDQLKRLNRVYPERSKEDTDALLQESVRREMDGTPPLSTHCTWQTFRSNKTTAFPRAPHEYILKDYSLRDVTHRVYDGLADNYTVQVQALHESTAFTTTDRPLAKPTVPLSIEMQRLKREASKAPPPKGRRNLNSQEFLGALSHDFCPISASGKIPTDYSYAIWAGNGTTKIEPTVIQSLPVKEYGGKWHPSLYEEKVVKYAGPEDTRFLRYRNVDILDRNIEVRGGP